MKKIKKHDDKSVHLKLVYQYSHTLFLPPPPKKKMWKEIRPTLFKKNRTLFEVDSDTVVVWLDLGQWGKKKSILVIMKGKLILLKDPPFPLFESGLGYPSF